MIHHRGPDGQGMFTEGNVGIGSTRLAIIDPREISNMPIYDAKKIRTVLNGEFRTILKYEKSLYKKDTFHTDSDTEVVLNAYMEWGEERRHKFRGMWAFGFWDKQEKTLFCSRDRFGIKPLYYYIDDNLRIFGSEIKQILDCGVDKSVNEETIYDYLVFHFIDHTENTFFKISQSCRQVTSSQ